MKVVLIGASDKTERYAYQALQRLQEKGHIVFPVHPTLKDIARTKVYQTLSEIPDKINTVTLYINAEKSSRMQADILKLNPQRIIFNPGAENDSLKTAAEAKGIQAIYGCTLVMLSTGQF